MSTLGSRVRGKRLLLGWTQQKLSDVSGVSTAYLSQIERDQWRPKIELIEWIARALDTSPDWLLNGDGEHDGPSALAAAKLPGELAELAEKEHLSFGAVSALMACQRAVSRKQDGFDWGGLYRAVRKWL